MRDAAAWGIRPVVVRPAVVYGRGGGTPGMFVSAARQKGRGALRGRRDAALALRARGRPGGRCTCSRWTLPAGTVLNAAAGPSLSVREVAEAAAQANGAEAEAWPLEEAREQLGPYADALALDQQVSAERALGFGWKPSRRSVLDDLRTGSYTR